jgi:hypothetical protein
MVWMRKLRDLKELNRNVETKELIKWNEDVHLRPSATN